MTSMKIYKIHLDMTMVLSRLKKFKLKEYNSAFPIVFIEAKSPDDACFKVVYQLIKMILDQGEDTVDTRLLCKNVKRDIRITKVDIK